MTDHQGEMLWFGLSSGAVDSYKIQAESRARIGSCYWHTADGFIKCGISRDLKRDPRFNGIVRTAEEGLGSHEYGNRT